MWKDEYSRFKGLTKKIHDEHRYDLSRFDYWICDRDEDGFRRLEILYLDSDGGCILFSKENEIFGEEGMQIKLIDCQWADIRADLLSEITELMTTSYQGSFYP
tara:strand:- start:31 stop:339 length:309 start_codon:yes stop_codon:yes gene_type:complete